MAVSLVSKLERFHYSQSYILWIEVVVFLQVPGAQEYAITSDDLFFLQKPPGRTFVFVTCFGFHSISPSAGWLSEEVVSFLFLVLPLKLLYNRKFAATLRMAQFNAPAS